MMPSIGKYLDGRDVTIPDDPFYHMIIGGENGSGKTSWIDSIIAGELYSPVILWGIDCKGGVSLVHWQNRFERIAENPTAATPLLTDANEIMEQRLAWMKRHKAKIYPGNRLIIIIDELIDMFSINAAPEEGETIKEATIRAKAQRDLREAMLNTIASKGRAAKITLIFATQHPVVDVLPNTIKANLVLRICCKVASSEALGVVLGHGVTDGLKITDIPDGKPGAALVKGFPEIGWDIRLARNFYYSDRSIAKAMAQFDYEEWATHYNIDPSIKAKYDTAAAIDFDGDLDNDPPLF